MKQWFKQRIKQKTKPFLRAGQTGFAALFWLLMAVSVSTAAAADLKPVRVGVLQFGTVNWVLDSVQHQKLAEKYGVDLQLVPLSGKDASPVALQGGAVDMIVNDWIWVTRMRAEGKDYTFVPYSNAVGSVMVPADKGFKTLADLAGKKLGVAGGPVDKTWLLLRAYSQKTLGKDLKDMLEPQFAAPPLLNELALKGELDGVVNFWHYAARLQAAGMQPLLDMPEILKTLGIERQLPLIGWVFSEKWAADNPETIQGFLQAVRDASAELMTSDEEWVRLKPLMKADDDAIFTALRDAYRAGVPTCFGAEEMAASQQTFSVLAQLGGKELAGDSTEITAGTFWDGFKFPACAAD